MAIVRWDPFRDLATLQERMNRIFDESFRGAARQDDEDWATGGSWAPLVDIYERDGNLELKAELPGVDPKDVDVSLTDGSLVIKGEKKEAKEEKKKNYHKVERFIGQFYREIPLPSGVDAEKISAITAKGVITVTVPKKPEAQSKKIAVKAAE